MKNTPFLHALGAAAYIIAVAYVLNSFQDVTLPKDTIFVPMFMLSLLVFSVTIMAFLFGYQPMRLYMDGYKSAATSFFMRTLGFFAIFVVIFFMLLMYVVLR